VLFRKVYEDNAIGKLSDERFTVMSQDYEREQRELREQNAELQVQLDAYEQDTQSAAKFLALAKKYPDFDELTPQMLHEFVDKVLVHEGVHTDDGRQQQLDIYLNFIGQFAVPQEPEPEPTPEEIAAAEKERARKKHRREYHKQWRDKRKAAKLAAMEKAREEK